MFIHSNLKKIYDYRNFIKQVIILFIFILGLTTTKAYIDKKIENKYEYIANNVIYNTINEQVLTSNIETLNLKLKETSLSIAKVLNNEVSYTEHIFSSSIYICNSINKQMTVFYSNRIDVAYSIFNDDKINIDTDMNQSGIYISEALYNSLECPDELKLSVSRTSESISFPIAGIYKDENEETKMGRMYCSLSVFEIFKEDYEKISSTELIVLKNDIRSMKINDVYFNNYNFRIKMIHEEKSIYNIFYTIINFLLISITITLCIGALWILFELYFKDRTYDKLNLIMYSKKSKNIVNEILFLLFIGTLILFLCLLVNFIISSILFYILGVFIFKMEIYFIFIIIYAVVVTIYTTILKNILLNKYTLK